MSIHATEEMNQGQYMALAYPWDEEEVIKAAVKDYGAMALQPTRDRLIRATRGSQIKRSLIYKRRGRRMDGGATRDSHKGHLGGLIVASSVSGQLGL